MSGCSWLDSSRARGGPASGLARMLGSGSQPSLEGVGSAFVAGLDVRTQSLPCRNGGAAHCTHDAMQWGPVSCLVLLLLATKAALFVPLGIMQPCSVAECTAEAKTSGYLRCFDQAEASIDHSWVLVR